MNDVKAFDQVFNLKKFIESNASSANFQKYLSHEKRVLYFNSFKNSEYYSELLFVNSFSPCLHRMPTLNVFSARYRFNGQKRETD